MQANKQRILIVEDDEDMLFLLEKALSGAGYLVESCRAGTGIVNFRHVWPDLFILDKNLPTIDGIAVCKFLRLQEHTKHIPIVMISAYPLKQKPSDVGVDFFLQKPFDLDSLLTVIERCGQKVANTARVLG